MDVGVVSAGTFVAAVLEHMGYVTQATFLQSFRDFFRDAGALVYLIGAAGGVMSVVLYGSFRAARYLIVGPAFYWFLIGPTVNTEGVVWQLGGGQPRGLLGQQGEGAAKADIRAVGKKAGTDGNERYRVAVGFWLFAKPINDFVKEFVDIMLKNEDGEDLMVADKVRGLEMISRSIPDDPAFIHRLEEGLMKHCIRTNAAAQGVAESYIKARATSGISPTTRSANLARYKEIQEKRMGEFKRVAKEERIPTDSTGFKELIEIHANNGDGKARAAQPAYSASDGEKENDKVALPNITCAEGWEIFFEELWHHAGRAVPEIVQLSSGDWRTADGQQKACSELARKLYGDQENAPCELRPGIALAVMWNHMSRMDTFGRVASRHINSRDPYNPARHAAFVGPKSQGFSFTKAADGSNVVRRESSGGRGYTSFLTEKITQIGADVYRIVREWAPLAQITNIHGIDHSTYVALPAYETVRIRQQIFTWAMQMPYYQGVILYLIAVAYPFICLIVLLPGRAQNIVNLPLAWLWVKSWDIGFAGVILLERVMYNILPNWGLPASLQRGPWNSYELLPTVLSEAYNFNPAGSVLMHYTVISMVLMGIPVLTGAMTLKARRGILGSFTDAINSQARDAASRAAGAYSIAASNQRAAMMKQVKGFAALSTNDSPGGPLAGLKGASARTWGGYLGILNAANSSAADSTGKIAQGWSANTGSYEDKGKMLGGFVESLGGVAGGWEKSIRVTSSVAVKEANFDAAFRAAFDPVTGRWGASQMLNDAYAAALDGAGARLQGGFETNDQLTNAVDEFIDLFGTKVALSMEAREQIGALQGAMLADPLKKDGFDAVASFASRALVMATGAEYAENGKSDYVTEAFKQVAQGQGYETDQFTLRLWNVDRFVMQDPEVKQALADVAAKGEASSADMFGAMFSSSSQRPALGGPSNQIDSYLSAMGGTRTVTEVRASSPAGIPGVATEPDEDGYSRALPNPPAAWTPPSWWNGGKQFYAELPDGIMQARMQQDDWLETNNKSVYDQEVQQQVSHLNKLYGTTNLTLPELIQHSAEIDKVLPQHLDDGKENKALKLDPNLGAIAKEQPLLASQLMDEWYGRRSGRESTLKVYGGAPAERFYVEEAIDLSSASTRKMKGARQ